MEPALLGLSVGVVLAVYVWRSARDGDLRRKEAALFSHRRRGG